SRTPFRPPYDPDVLPGPRSGAQTRLLLSTCPSGVKLSTDAGRAARVVRACGVSGRERPEGNRRRDSRRTRPGGGRGRKPPPSTVLARQIRRPPPSATDPRPPSVLGHRVRGRTAMPRAEWPAQGRTSA